MCYTSKFSVSLLRIWFCYLIMNYFFSFVVVYLDVFSCQPPLTTASLKTALEESAAQLALPCFAASSGKSTFGGM